MDIIIQLVLALSMALGIATADHATTIVDVRVDVQEDSSASVTLDYTAPRCPLAHDEPCYVVVLVDHEDGIHDVDAGP
jgi:hypothetical protein